MKNTEEPKPDYMKAGVGTKDTEALKPAKVKITSIRFQTETKEGKKMDTPLVHFEVKHPDNEDLISISKTKFERNGKLEVVGNWAALDEDNAFKKNSAVSAVLTFLDCSNLEECYGKEINTVEQSNEVKYLCLKAY